MVYNHKLLILPEGKLALGIANLFYEPRSHIITLQFYTFNPSKLGKKSPFSLRFTELKKDYIFLQISGQYRLK